MESDQLPAVSALRSKFERLAQDSASSTPSSQRSPLRQETQDVLAAPSSRQRALSSTELDSETLLSGLHLRPSSSSSDLKSSRRPPPPPPPSRSSKPTSHTLKPSLSFTSTPSLPSLHHTDKSSLVARKPPPPPASSHMLATISSPSSSPILPTSRYLGKGIPSQFNSRAVSPGTRIVSHPTHFPSAPPSISTDFSTHQSRHSTSDIQLESPLIQLHDSPFSDEAVPPPLPSRTISSDLKARESDVLAHPKRSSSQSSNGNGSSDSERGTDLSRPASPPPHLPPPAHPNRSPFTNNVHRHSSPQASNNDEIPGSYSDIPSSSNSSLQVPPPLPVRRSPPITSRDLPEPKLSTTFTPPVLDRRNPSSPHIAPPPARTIAPGGKLPPVRRPTSTTLDGSTSDSAEEEDASGKVIRLVDQLPDASNSSRRPPLLSNPAFLHARPAASTHTGVMAVCGSIFVVAHHQVKIYDLCVSDQPLHSFDLREADIEWRAKEPRVTAMEFRPTRDQADRGRFLWLGTKDGYLWEIDVQTGSTTSVRPSAHNYPVAHIFRYARQMITLDENGKLLIFNLEEDERGALTSQSNPRVLRVADKQGFVKLLGGLLWMSSGPGTSSAPTSHLSAIALPRGPAIRVYDIFSNASSVPFKTVLPTEHVGAVTSASLMQSHPNRVYLGHEGGTVTIWNISSDDKMPVCEDIVKVSVSDVLCLEGVYDRLWIGGRGGTVTVYSVEHKPWLVTNCWSAHGEFPVQKLFVDPWSIEKCGHLTVVSIGKDEHAKFWDGLLGLDWKDGQLLHREISFSSYRALNVLVVSWNVDAAKPDSLTGSSENMGLLETVLKSVESPDIICFGFQELIDLENRKMAAKTVLLGNKKKATDGGLSEKVSRSYKLWHDRLTHTVRLVMPSDCPYSVVHTESLVGLFTCVFIKSSIRNSTTDVSVMTVKRGIGGRYGNKGGIVSRLVVDDSSICFINCHLAAGQHHIRSRNADIASILEEKEVFPPAPADSEALAYVGGGDGSMILDHEIVFLNGDLNYRIDQRRESVIAAIRASQLENLLVHDQLCKEMRNNRGFRLRSFVEPPIQFAPTYKYDRRSSEYDTSEKSRIPAWCDRILYRTRQSSRVRNLHYRRYEANVSDHRPISAGFEITVKSVDRQKREAVKQEIEEEWLSHQLSLLYSVQQFYASQFVL